ncbi:MAG: hypothetical protein JNK85_09740 [Verrucomicrobiales bacterium]|nr:hypothetical protein [Verrucomicrobiales bacterium]
MTTRPRSRPSIIFGALLVLCVASAGCRIAETAVELPTQAVRLATGGDKSRAAVDPVVLQQDVLRFADDFTTRMVLGIDKLRLGHQPLEDDEALQFKVAIASQVYAVASGSHSLAALVDLTVLVTVMRKTLENPMQSATFGDSVEFMVSSCRELEGDLSALARKALSADQLTELETSLGQWEQREVNLRDVLMARGEDLPALFPQRSRQQSARSGSVFGLLGVDPLAGVDPAVREVARTRLFAERALFVMQRMPRLLRWQAELTAIHATKLPAVESVVSNAGDLTASLNRFVRVAEQLPAQLAQERAEILKSLESQEGRLAPLAGEVRQALIAGSQMSTSLTVTLGTFDALMKRFGVGEPKPPTPPNPDPAAHSNPPAAPFRIQDYGETAARIEAAARQLHALVESVQDTLGSTNLSQLPATFEPAVQQARAGGKEVVDYAFQRGALLIGLCLAAALAYRFLAARLPLPRGTGQKS